MATTTLTRYLLPFLVGDIPSVVSELVFLLQKPKQQTILPASLNDIASLSHPLTRSFYRSLTIYLTDGMPLVWWFRYIRQIRLQRAYGPDVFLSVLQKLPPQTRHVFYGSSPLTQKILKRYIQKHYGDVQHALYISPPFRALTTKEEEELLQRFQNFNPTILWIGLSSPRQVEWMSHWKQKLPHTHFFCVGAAFDFVVGVQPQAPNWIQKIGLEWLFRLIHTPGRLAHRYLWHIPTGLIKLLCTD